MAAIALFQVPIILRKQRWRELLAFSALWLAALVYALLVAGRPAVPNPTEMLISLIERFLPWQAN